MFIQGDFQIKTASAALGIGQIACRAQHPGHQHFVQCALPGLFIFLRGSERSRAGIRGSGLAARQQQASKREGECAFEHDDPCARDRPGRVFVDV